jgi:glutamyl-tRNA synthetase
LGGRPPCYAHLPLILDHQGRRLAKRHAALSLAALREAGVRPENIFGFLARLAGLRDRSEPLAPGELLPRFDPGRLKPDPLRLPESLAADPAAALA